MRSQKELNQLSLIKQEEVNHLSKVFLYRNIMGFRRLSQFVSFLSAFKFTTNNVIGRMFVFMVLLSKKLCMSMTRFRTKPNGNILTIKTLIEILKVLTKERRSPLDTAIKLNDFELVKYFIEINPENVN